MSGGGGGNRNRLVIGLNLVTCWHLHSPQSLAFYLQVLAFTEIHSPIGQSHHCTTFMFPTPCREGLSNLLSFLIHFCSTLGAMEYLYTFLKPFWDNRECLQNCPGLICLLTSYHHFYSTVIEPSWCGIEAFSNFASFFWFYLRSKHRALFSLNDTLKGEV